MCGGVVVSLFLQILQELFAPSKASSIVQVFMFVDMFDYTQLFVWCSIISDPADVIAKLL